MIRLVKQLFQKNDIPQNLYSVDIHSHLLPGLDDGAKDMQESIELIKQLKELGFQKLITTPHIMSHKYKNSAEKIYQTLSLLHAELKIRKIDIIVEAASEYYLDTHFMSLLKKREILTFGDNYLLFEHAYNLKPANYESLIFEIKLSGYKPVLAHPERYLFMHKDFEMYERLKEMGVFFQLNLNSMDGYYSKDVQKIAHKLVERGWIDFIGSDTHHATHLRHLKKVLQSKNLAKIFQYNTILNQKLL